MLNRSKQCGIFHRHTGKACQCCEQIIAPLWKVRFSFFKWTMSFRTEQTYNAPMQKDRRIDGCTELTRIAMPGVQGKIDLKRSRQVYGLQECWRWLLNKMFGVKLNACQFILPFFMTLLTGAKKSYRNEFSCGVIHAKSYTIIYRFKLWNEC